MAVGMAASIGLVQTAAATSHGDGAGSRVHARQLTEAAVAAASYGECAKVHELAAIVRDLDPEVYRDAFAGDRDIARCGPLDVDARATAVTSALVATAPQPASPPPLERSSLVLGVGADLGGIAHVDGNVGWMVNARLALFGTVIAGGEVPDRDTTRTYRVYGAGVRAWPFHHLFLGVRVGRASTQIESGYGLFGGPPDITRGHGVAGLAEIGIEGLLGGAVGGDLHIGYANMAGIAGLFVGLGVTLY